MSSTNNTPIVAEGKIVALNEFKKKAKANRNKNLSPGEKVLFCLVDAPLSAVAGISFAFSNAARQGMYTDENRNIYVSGSFVNSSAQHLEHFAVAKKVQGKINRLEAEAFEQCADQSSRDDLKPVLTSPKL